MKGGFLKLPLSWRTTIFFVLTCLQVHVVLFIGRISLFLKISGADVFLLSSIRDDTPLLGQMTCNSLSRSKKCFLCMMRYTMKSYPKNGKCSNSLFELKSGWNFGDAISFSEGINYLLVRLSFLPRTMVMLRNTSSSDKIKSGGDFWYSDSRFFYPVCSHSGCQILPSWDLG